ncbi:MAG: DUF3662 domain-containing protein [Actinomycetia bacterium]|nr:DUF3662 domain-containing protein [Actinomycetes bacterium]
MVMRGFERRLERLVEGGFARAFRGAVEPVEIGRRVVRVLDDERTLDVHGSMTAPNMFAVWLSQADLDRFTPMQEALVRELGDLARTHARERGYRFVGNVVVSLAPGQGYREGRFEVTSALEANAENGPGSLVFSDGSRVALGTGVTIGREAACNLQIEDPRVSRRHVGIEVAGAGYRLVDLGSTNGTRVNQSPVADHTLVDLDIIEIAGREIRFEAS